MSQNMIVELLGSLSFRERQVLSLLLEGFDCKEISESMQIQKTTVTGHMRNIYQIVESFGFNLGERRSKHVKLTSLLRRTDFEKHLNISLTTLEF